MLVWVIFQSMTGQRVKKKPQLIERLYENNSLQLGSATNCSMVLPALPPKPYIFRLKKHWGQQSYSSDRADSSSSEHPPPT